MKYVRESATSYQGAVDNLPRAGTQKARILEAIEACGDYGCLREDLERPLGLSGNAVRPRVVELIEARLVKETERTRRTRSGSQAAVLVVNSGVGAGEGIELRGGVVDDQPSTDSGVHRNPYEAEVWVE